MEIKVELTELQIKRALCKMEHTHYDSDVECDCGYCEDSDGCCHCELCDDCSGILYAVFKKAREINDAVEKEGEQ